MSLLGYQQALCELVASPRFCLAVRRDPSSLDPYDLTERERARLASVVTQRGMSTSCTLYRVNRIAPVFSYLPLTCAVLGDELIHEAERHWEAGKPPNLQFESETVRFTNYLKDRLEAGGIENPYLEEVLLLELAAHALASGADPPRRTVRFRHDPVALLALLADRRQPAVDEVELGEYLVELDASGGAMKLRYCAIPTETRAGDSAQDWSNLDHPVGR